MFGTWGPPSVPHKQAASESDNDSLAASLLVVEQILYLVEEPLALLVFLAGGAFVKLPQQLALLVAQPLGDFHSNLTSKSPLFEERSC